jgi:hypothetical protein
MASLLRQAVEHADNFRPIDPTLFQFRVFAIPFPVGFIREAFMGGNFNPANFKVDRTNRIVTLAPDLKGRTAVQACDEAFIEFCQQNTGLCPGFAPWLAKSPAKRDWHAIFGMEEFDPSLKGLRIVTPLRGCFGVATAGVHCNVYQTKMVGNKEVIDCIWLSKRSATATFPLAPDNCFSGAMDPEDDMIPLKAFKREGEEEAGMILAADGKTMMYQGKKCGELRGKMQTLSIATLKGPITGPKEDGHIEFALRFAFDVCLVPGFSPNPHDSDVEKFHPIKVSNLKDAFAKPWKYSSGAVMVDWVLRHNLMEVSEAEKRALQERLHYKIPLKSVQKYLK